MVTPPTDSLCWLYVGTRGSGPDAGLSCARFDPATGALSAFTLAAKTADPGFFVAHPGGQHIYSCNSGTPGGVSAFRVDQRTGALTFLNLVGSDGRGPSHVSLDWSGHAVLTANYGGGYVDVVSIEPDGALGELTARVRHQGHGADPVRQSQPHAHCVRVDPANRFALVADLGLDRVYVYRFDASHGTLGPHDPPYATVAPRSGPRHLAWHPNGRWLYLIEELSNRVTLFTWDPTGGRLDAQQTVPTLPSGFGGENIAAELLVRSDGRFAYASNRGHDSVAIFAVDRVDGRLTPVAHVASGGRTPRYMAIDPSNHWLFVANIDSDTIAQFRIDQATGELARVGTPHRQPKPSCLAFCAS
jgi:6-phosphogluconolactonase